MSREIKSLANKFIAYIEAVKKGDKTFDFVIGDDTNGPSTILGATTDSKLSEIITDDDAKTSSSDLKNVLVKSFRMFSAYTALRIRYGSLESSGKDRNPYKFFKEACDLLDVLFGKSSTPLDTGSFAVNPLTYVTAFINDLQSLVGNCFKTKKDVTFEDGPLSGKIVKIYSAMSAPMKRSLKFLWTSVYELSLELAYSPNTRSKAYGSAKATFKDAVDEFNCVAGSKDCGRASGKKARKSKTCSPSRSKSRRSKSAKRRKARSKSRGSRARK